LEKPLPPFPGKKTPSPPAQRAEGSLAGMAPAFLCTEVFPFSFRAVKATVLFFSARQWLFADLLVARFLSKASAAHLFPFSTPSFFEKEETFFFFLWSKGGLCGGPSSEEE